MSFRRSLAPLIFSVLGVWAIRYFPVQDRFSVDFIQYYSSWNLVRDHQNPYSPGVLLSAQRLIRPAITEPTMMWNPPWVLFIIGPLGTVGYELAWRVWLALNLVFLGISAFYLRELDLSRRMLTVIGAALVSFPLWVCLAFGQVSILLLLGGVLLIYGHLKQRLAPFLAGVFLCSLKPHLFVVAGFVILHRLFRERRYRELFAPVVLMTVVAVGTELVFPGQIRNWLTSLNHPEPPAVAPVLWRVTTLVGAVRGLFADSQGMVPIWPMVVVPLSPLILYLVWTIRTQRSLNLERLWPGLLGVSYLFSLYGWTFDAVLLLPCFVSVLCSIFVEEQLSGPKFWVPCGLLLAQCLAYGLFFVPGLVLSQSSFWWLPLLIFLSWVYESSHKDSRFAAC